MMIDCPSGLRSIAERIGVDPEDVEDLWDRHVALCEKDGDDYGGPRWKGLCEKHVRDGSVARVRRVDDATRAAWQRAEAQARAAADAAYKREAISLSEYLDSLTTAPTLTEAEERLISCRRFAREQVGPWMVRAMLTARPSAEEFGVEADAFPEEPRSVPARRRQPCATDGCHGEAVSWTREGRRYAGALCATCTAQAAERRRRAAERAA